MDNPLSSTENFVYAAGMNLAWQELKSDLIHDDLKFAGLDDVAQKLVDAFNLSPDWKADIQPQNYYVKAGFGQETVQILNREVQQKFPQKKMLPLDLKLSAQDLIAYAMLLVEVDYPTPFTATQIFFKDVNTKENALPPQVRGFRAENQEQKNNLSILNYVDNENFVLRLKVKQPGEEIILVKGSQNMTADELVKSLQPHFVKQGEALTEIDYFQMPMLHLDHAYRYDSLIGKKFQNPDFADFMIGSMSERTIFAMDERGARVENEAMILAPSAIQESGPTPKYLFFDKPFWVLMKKTDSNRPYFILGVKTVDVMEVVGN